MSKEKVLQSSDVALMTKLADDFKSLAIEYEEQAVKQENSGVPKLQEEAPVFRKMAREESLIARALREMAERENREPPYDPDYQGLKHKYNVYKAEDGSRVESCFVLRPDKDPAAVAALRAYAGATDNAQLATDITDWIGGPEPLTMDELRGMVGEPVWVTCMDGSNGAWGIVNVFDDVVCVIAADLLNYPFYDHKEDPIAYRTKPVDVAPRRCRVCGCTDDCACPGGCYWVEPDLCSACVGREQQKTKED